MPESQFYTMLLKLDREFLRQTYQRPGIREIAINDELNNELWESTQGIVEVAFGGKFGTQFASLEEFQSFNSAFDDMLKRKGFDPKHKNQLLYFMVFYGEDSERQSLDNNLHNRLNDYEKFILDLGYNSLAHFEKMESNKEYTKIYDEATQEYLFAKNTLFDKMTLEEIVERSSDDKVTYMRMQIGKNEMYIPWDLVFNIRSERKLKAMDGEPIDNFDLPNHFQYHLFKYTLDFMVSEHKRCNTEFYHKLSTIGLTPHDYKSLYNQNKQHKISENKSLYKLMIAISDYLETEINIKTKVAKASFLFEYFSLFKVFKLKSNPQYPEDYRDLVDFHRLHNIDKETIRTLIKDSARSWGNLV